MQKKILNIVILNNCLERMQIIYSKVNEIIVALKF